MRHYALVVTAVMLAPATAQPLMSQRLEIAEVHRTSGSSAAPFGEIGSMLEVAANVVWVTDPLNKAVYQWEVTGNRVARVAREGRGPGEVLSPVVLSRRPSGGVALYDVGHSAVLLFGSSLDYERLVRLQGGIVSNPKSLAVLADESLLISGGRLRDPRHIHRYTSTGEWAESYGSPTSAILSDYAKIQSAGGALRSHGQGFSFGAPLRILRFPASNFSSPAVLTEDPRILPDLSEDVLHGPPDPQRGNTRPFLWWHDRSTGVFVLPDGRVLNVITRFHSGDSVWDLYAPDGRRVTRTIVPRAYYAWDMSPSGNVLASYRDPDTDEHIATVLRVSVR